MSDPFLRSHVFSRRGFLTGSLAGAVPGSLLLRGTPDDPEDLAAFGRLVGLEFTADEAELAGDRLRRQRQQYEALRQAEVPFELSPAAVFDPVPASSPPPARETAPLRWEPQEAAAPESDLDLAFAGVDRLAAWLRQGRVTSRRLTELAIARMKQHGSKLHCVVTLLEEPALAAADRADAEIREGKWRSPLHGIPYGAKDLFAWPGAPTSFGAAPYRNRVWGDVKATVLEKLENAGAVLVAKTSLGALAMGDVWFGGTTRNPWNPEQGSSGSSAGSAAAVAAGLLPFALGTETLGSIVSPCLRCGVAGLRPTFGTVSRYGAMPLSWTMDKVGPIARSAVDAALVFDAISGADAGDPSSRDAPFPWRRGGAIDGLRIGLLDAPRVDWDEGDGKRFREWLASQGAKPVPAKLPEAPYTGMRVILSAEASASFDDLMREGGLRKLTRQDASAWPNSMRTARAIPAVEYLRASRLRRKLVDDMAATMAGVDVLVAPPYGGQTLLCTNLTGHPAYVLPVGRSTRGNQNGKPTVLTLIGKLFGEAGVLTLAERWQAQTDWHLARPPISS